MKANRGNETLNWKPTHLTLRIGGGELKRVILISLLLLCLGSSTIVVYVAPAISPIINRSTTLLSFTPGTFTGQVEYYEQTDLTFNINWTFSGSELNPPRVDMLIFSNDSSFNTWASNPNISTMSGLAYRHIPNIQLLTGFSTGSMSKSDPTQFPSSGGITHCDIMFIDLSNTSSVDMKFSLTVEWDSVGRVIEPLLSITLAVTVVIATAGIVLTQRRRSAFRKSPTKGTSASES
jgi:hypothetical protein